MKRLFLLAGPPGSGKTTLTLACRADPQLQIFGEQTGNVRWQAGYSVVDGGKQIVFREDPAADAPSVSIKGFMLYPQAELVDPPDGLLVHVDLLTLARVDSAARPAQTRKEIARNFEDGLRSLLQAYDEVYLATLQVDRDELASRMVSRLLRRQATRRIKSTKQRVRLALGTLARAVAPAGVSDKVFGAVLGGNREQIYFVDDGAWLEKITQVWKETAARIATESFVVETGEGRFRVTRET